MVLAYLRAKYNGRYKLVSKLLTRFSQNYVFQVGEQDISETPNSIGLEIFRDALVFFFFKSIIEGFFNPINIIQFINT